VKLSDAKKVPVVEKTDTAKVRTKGCRISLGKDGKTYQLFDLEDTLIAESDHPLPLLKLVEAKGLAEQVVHDYRMNEQMTFDAEIKSEPVDAPVEKKP